MDTAIVTGQQVPPIEGSLNLLQECLKETNRFSETIYTNICDGTTHSIPSGFWDYVLNIGLVLCIALVLMLLVLFVINVFLDTL